jgi:hypothetical protein
VEADEIRLIVRQKLQDGRLPYNSMPRFWGGPADGETCDVCDMAITKQQLVMEGIASTLSDKKPFSFTSRASTSGMPRGARRSHRRSNCAASRWSR